MAKNKYLKNCQLIIIVGRTLLTYKRSYSVEVSTRDFESLDDGSIPSKTKLFFG